MLYLDFQKMSKKSRQKLIYLEIEKRFYSEIKSFFIIFKELPIAKYCLRLETAPLKYLATFAFLGGQYALKP